MPPTPRAKAPRTPPTAEQKRLLAAMKTERAKLKQVEATQKQLLTKLQNTVAEFNRAHKARSDIQSNLAKTLDSIANNFK